MKLLPIMKNACSFYCYLLSSLPLCLCITSVCCLVINLACKLSVEESVLIMVCVHSPRGSGGSLLLTGTSLHKGDVDYQ